MRYTTASSRLSVHTHHRLATGRSISRHQVSSAPTTGACMTYWPRALYVGLPRSATVASRSHKVCESMVSASRRMIRTYRSSGKCSR
jgi:hypothetical protein